MSQTKTALLSAYDKTGLVDFAQGLVALGWNLLASGGTAKVLAATGIPVRDVAEIVGPPILGHRVVTLSREVHAALLATDSPEDQAELDRIGVPRIDLVYVDLYPLEEVEKKPDRTLADILEKTDIGGPTMLRSAAKGQRLVAFDIGNAQLLLRYLRGEIKLPDDAKFRTIIAAFVETHVSQYCALSARLLDEEASAHKEIMRRAGLI